MPTPLAGGTRASGRAVSLIIGTAVGPGMLGLPSATIRSGQATSAATILLSWAYVVSSIVLVAELSFSAMEQDGVDEVSFTGLASSTLGADLGTVVVVVYAALSFSFIVAYVSGIGSLVAQLFPRARPAPFGHAKQNYLAGKTGSEAVFEDLDLRGTLPNKP
ncbi:uncharacterized protein [Setaria viridis]|uniref:uncharacterized protein n=1 Tax=Setaria viridis TaxID=4556 RepID=UPI00149397C7|nr:uncharacterized protein LOC117861916 [Setaria viridis]